MMAADRPTVPRRFSTGAQAVTLLVALLACACGAALAWREPATAPRHQAAKQGRPAATAPAVTALPYGSHVTGTIEGIDQHLGAIRVSVGGEEYVYHVDYRTIFPDRCLTRGDLRDGEAVRLVLPWYLSGNVSIEAMLPLKGCGTPPASAQVVSHTGDSPPDGAGAR
jgi:hypothetical protein